jgi:secreted trypsin-like serine protease
MKLSASFLICFSVFPFITAIDLVEPTFIESDLSNQASEVRQERSKELLEDKSEPSRQSRIYRRKEIRSEIREDRDLKFSNQTSTEQRIVGGNAADFRRYPYFVQGFGCGAILIRRDIVLTAAHCEGAFWSEVLVGPARNANSGWAQWRSIVNNRMYVHPNFSWETMENDFMIFKIRPVTATNILRAIRRRPVRLNADPAFPTSGLPLNVIGYGAVKENGAQSSILQEVVVNSVPSGQCDNAYGGAIYPATQMWYVDCFHESRPEVDG